MPFLITPQWLMEAISVSFVEQKQIMSARASIAIIGATGRMGSALAKSLAKGNYRLLLFANDLLRSIDLANEIREETSTADLDCFECAADASWEADIIIPAVPFSAEREIGRRIKDVATQKIIISISNPMTDENATRERSAAEDLQDLLPHSKVVKAFNTVCASHFATTDEKRVDSFIAGDNEDANEIVAALVKTSGFNPVLVGRLSQSRTLENMAALLLQVNKKNQFNRATGYKIMHH